MSCSHTVMEYCSKCRGTGDEITGSPEYAALAKRVKTACSVTLDALSDQGRIYPSEMLLVIDALVSGVEKITGKSRREVLAILANFDREVSG